jgi:hypothetical protein
LPPVSLIPVVHRTLTCKYFCEFLKNFERVLMGYSGAGGNRFMKKTRSKKSRDTVPLMWRSYAMWHLYYGTLSQWSSCVMDLLRFVMLR